jgi:hypothetical protein
MEYCTNIRGLFCAYFRGLIQATANNAQTLNHQAVIIALLSFYGLYFAFYGLFGLYPYVYMACAIVRYMALYWLIRNRHIPGHAYGLYTRPCVSYFILIGG